MCISVYGYARTADPYLPTLCLLSFGVIFRYDFRNIFLGCKNHFPGKSPAWLIKSYSSLYWFSAELNFPTYGNP